jgi:hypothetical protein
MNRIWTIAAIAVAFAAGFLVHPLAPGAVAHAQAGPKVYELRTYTAPAGKLGELHARFRNHTLRIFKKHGMGSVGYFAPADAPLKDNTLIYVLAHDSREAATKSWDEFRKDPEWVKVAADSQVNGKIVDRVESVFMTATDYSPMK